MTSAPLSTTETSMLYFMAALYFIAGVFHFVKPQSFVDIIPPWLPSWFPNAAVLVALSGVAEILLALLLVIPATRVLGAWGIIALLVAVFPANLYMFQNQVKFHSIPVWVLALRLPLQGVLIAWAYYFT